MSDLIYSLEVTDVKVNVKIGKIENVTEDIIRFADRYLDEHGREISWESAKDFYMDYMLDQMDGFRDVLDELPEPKPTVGQVWFEFEPYFWDSALPR